MDAPITVTVYANEHATEGVCAETTWEKVVASLSRGTVTACTPCAGKNCKAKKGKAWAPHRMPPGRRLKANVLAVTAAVYDIDDIDRNDCIEMIASLEAEGYEYLLHSTHNHCRIEETAIGEDGKKKKIFRGYEAQDDLGLCATQNRLRLVVPLTREATRDEWERVWPAAKDVLGLHPDASCKDSSRLYYHPSIPQGLRIVLRRGVGKPLDVDAVLAMAPRPVRLPDAAPRQTLPVFDLPDDDDDGDASEVGREKSEDDDEMSMPALRKRLIKYQRKKARSTDPSDIERYQLITAIIAGTKLAERGDVVGEFNIPKGRSQAINKTASILAHVLPLGTDFEIAWEFLRPCIAAMDNEETGEETFEHWHEIAEESYARALGRAFEADRARREMYELTQDAFADAANALASESGLFFPSARGLAPVEARPPASSMPMEPPVLASPPANPSVSPTFTLPFQIPTSFSVPFPATTSSPITPPANPDPIADPLADILDVVGVPAFVPAPNALPPENPKDGTGFESGGVPSDGSDPDAWQKTLLMTADKKIKNVSANYYKILANSPSTKGFVHMNSLTKRIEVWGGPFQDTKQPVLVTTITHWMQDSGKVTPEEAPVRASLVRLAYENEYNPVKLYLDNLVWDGVPRLDKFLSTYVKARKVNASGTDITPYLECIAPKMFIAAVARIYKPGCQVDTMPVIEGAMGGEGKSSLIKILFDPWYTETRVVVGDKDSLMILTSSWGVEFAELASVRRSDDDSLKSYLTVRIDKFRPPYGGEVQDYPRQCVFWGTTNEEDWNTHGKGRRRFWPFYAESIDLEAVARDKSQIWAEAVARYKAGERWHLMDQERDLADAESDSRVVATFVEQQIEDWWYNMPAAKRPFAVTLSMIVEALKIAPERVNRALQTEIGNAMVRRLGFKKAVMVQGTRKTYVWKPTQELMTWAPAQPTSQYARITPSDVN